ncbi:MAG: hypothetical protein RMK90_15720, partial [Acetobacteraceae bacterium]|nr:hypothetical protein [Acetobacteraceae bacterium]
MSCEQNHLLDTLARMAGVAKADLDGAWATATVVERQARQATRATEAAEAAEAALRSPDADLIAQLWGGSGHGEPTKTTRRALIAALRTLEQQRKGSPARLAALRHLLGEPSASPPSPFWRAVVTGRVPPDLDVDRRSAWDAAELLA